MTSLLNSPQSIWIVILSMLVATGCDSSTRPSTSNPDDVGGRDSIVVQLNWRPESEHGGVYQAKSAEIYSQANLDVEIRPGGGATQMGTELELERCQFAMANADDVVLYRARGMDVVAVMAVMQNHPRCILVRADSGVTELAGLAGLTLQCDNSRAFIKFMRRQGLLEGVQEVPYHGSVASLVGDAKIALQGYSFSEPLLAKQQGVEVRTLMLSDIGWNPYSSVLITSGRMIREQPELVHRFVQATRDGWQAYLQDPALGNTAILAANEHGMTQEALDFGHQGLSSLAMPEGFPKDQVGVMSLDRWQTLVTQMQELEIIEPDQVQAGDCFTTEFLSDASP